MRKSTIIGLILAATASSATLAHEGQHYGDTLAAMILARHPELRGLRIASTTKDGKPILIEGGATTGAPTAAPIVTAMGDTVGEATLFYKGKAMPARTAKVATEIGHRIYTTDGLNDADPFVAGAKRSPLAQKLVDEAIDADPLLVTIGMHVTPVGQPNNIIAASNFGRIGKLGDADDAKVMSGEIIRDTTNGGKRLAVAVPMKDRAGTTIGALSTSYKLGPDLNPAQAEARALKLRDWLAQRTPSLAVLTAY